MSIRTWSLTKLWAVTAATWVGAWVLLRLCGYFDISGLLPFTVAAVPGFLAGVWAGSHPELAEWPRVRIVALWVFALGTIIAASDFVWHWSALTMVVAAPAAVLSLRWYELTHAQVRLGHDPAPIVTPPPRPNPPQLPPQRS